MGVLALSSVRLWVRSSGEPARGHQTVLTDWRVYHRDEAARRGLDHSLVEVSSGRDVDGHRQAMINLANAELAVLEFDDD